MHNNNNNSSPLIFTKQTNYWSKLCCQLKTFFYCIKVILCYMKSIIWHNKARKQMKKIPKQYQQTIHNHIDQLETFPNFKKLDIIALKNHKYDYRMRVGRYRIFFDDKNNIQIIAIQEVKKRDERTY